MDLTLREKVASGGPYEDLVGYSRVLVTGPFVYVAGTTAGSSGQPIPPSTAEQTRQTVEIIRGKLAEVRVGLDEVVRVRMFVVDIKRDWREVAEVMNGYFAATKPVMTMVQVAALIDDQMTIEIEMDASLRHGERRVAASARWRSSSSSSSSNHREESSIAMLGTSVPWDAAAKQRMPSEEHSAQRRKQQQQQQQRHALLSQHLQPTAEPGEPGEPGEPSFYSEHIDRYAAKPQQPVTLRSLLHMCAPPLTHQGLLSSAQYLWRERPVRYAQRVKLFQQLPYIVNLNPHINKVYRAYYANFEESRTHPAIDTGKEEENEENEEDGNSGLQQFAEMLARHAHVLQDVMPDIARGFYECRQYFGTADRKRFLDRLITMRIGLRLLTGQFVAQHHQWQAAQEGRYAEETEQGRFQGLVDTRLPLDQEALACAQSVQALCDMSYGAAPDFLVDGATNVSFRYVPQHLRYMLGELLKNAFRATLRLPEDRRRPVRITVAQGSGRVAVRVRDAAGGIPRDIHRRIFDYSFTTESHRSADERGPYDGADQVPGLPPIAGLGFGLPMTKVYAEYFGGALNLISMENHGCDAFLELPSIELTEKINI
ncbi:hypothetical protein LPJ53_005461 [Coemansia erecta]|uniref:Protein-serine/threonine kinase n=1 Tax=Coemansia erecta TaxID=147472 RepID=A0A9W7XWB2_9FUNG|nr:hypothetical protein LPJ53_005461 [Coemansia erecta]